MSDLRQRLMDAMDAAGNQWFDSYDGEADAALSVFADWLRERAEREVAAANLSGGNGDPFVTSQHVMGAVTLDELADEIDPKEHHA